MFIQHFHGASVSQRDGRVWWRLLLGICKQFRQIGLCRRRLGCAVRRAGAPAGTPVVSGGTGSAHDGRDGRALHWLTANAVGAR